MRHPKQHVSKQSCSNIQLSNRDGFKKKKKKKKVFCCACRHAQTRCSLLCLAKVGRRRRTLFALPQWNWRGMVLSPWTVTLRSAPCSMSARSDSSLSIRLGCVGFVCVCVSVFMFACVCVCVCLCTFCPGRNAGEE